MKINKIKSFLLSFVVIILTCVSTSCAFASDTTPMLVLDARNAPELPRNFRMATTISPEMRIAGGAQFSEMSLKKILERLRAKRIVLIDLRQESHGFLNGNAISWYGPQDAANAGKTAAQINSEQMQLLLGLLAKKSVNVNKIIEKSDKGYIAAVKPIEFAVHQVLSESELASHYHLNYYRLYVQDFHAPQAKEVDAFVQIIKNLPADKWVYVHCHAGVGRTTTFMAMYDMMKNAKTVSFEDILKRQQSIGGKDLQVLPDETSFKYGDAKERLAFLKKFYEYARDNKDHFTTPYSKM